MPEDVLAGVAYDIELGGAWLLGNDARKLTLAATTEKLGAVLADPAQTDSLVSDMARALLNKDDPHGHAAKLLEQFKKGFRRT